MVQGIPDILLAPQFSGGIQRCTRYFAVLAVFLILLIFGYCVEGCGRAQFTHVEGHVEGWVKVTEIDSCYREFVKKCAINGLFHRYLHV
jgi:hypothetical protein